MIANSQQPLQYHGFGVVVLNLETFSKVRTIRNQNQKQRLFEFNKRSKFIAYFIC